MHEILFRAKEISTDKWVEGYLVKISGDDYRIATEEDINWSYTKLGDYDGVMTCVNPETICQYTGLTDKNGNKIWENDVVCTPYVDPIFGDMVNREILDDYTWKVEFCDGCFCVLNDSHRIALKCFTNGKNIKVIGNIFDNPELLENE